MLKPSTQTTSFKTNRLLKEYWKLGAERALLLEIVSLRGDAHTHNKHFNTSVHKEKKKKKKERSASHCSIDVCTAYTHVAVCVVSAGMETHMRAHCLICM